MKKKSFFLMLLFCIITMLLLGAGKQEQKEKGPSFPKEPAGKVEISFMSNASYPYDKAVPHMVELFQKQNPNIIIKTEFNPTRKLWEIIELRMSAKESTPDLFFADIPLIAGYSLKGYLAPLDNYFTKEEKSNWVEAAVSASTVNGKLMAAPFISSATLMYYNKRHFKEAGIPFPPKDPSQRLTWEEVLEIAKKLTIDADKDGIPERFGLGLIQMNRPYIVLNFPLSLGAKSIGSDGLTTKGIIDTPEWIRALTFYRDLHNTWKVSPK